METDSFEPESPETATFSPTQDARLLLKQAVLPMRLIDTLQGVDRQAQAVCFGILPAARKRPSTRNNGSELVGFEGA